MALRLGLGLGLGFNRNGSGGGGAVADYRTDLVAEWQAGNDADFTLSGGDDIDNEEALTGGANYDLAYVGDGGYTVKAKHNASSDPINTQKTVRSDVAGDQSRYQTGAAGTMANIITGTVFSLVLVTKIREYNGAFGAPDMLFMAQNAVFRLRLTSATNLRWQVGVGGESVADAAVVADTGDAGWYIVICTYDNSKARISVDGGAAGEGATSAGLLAGNMGTRLQAYSEIGTGGIFGGAHKVRRIYNSLLTAEQQTQLIAYFRSQWPVLA